MSTSIEQRVVQMKFDNKQFESGVAQSMSTLDKLKAKLNFKGAADSFNEISRAADGVSLNGVVEQTDNLGNKFDALAIIAISALNRITNEAISAGTKLVKSLSIDQVSAGWSKYEARTAAVQTLVNATGRSVEDIEYYMTRLMRYSDETSYGFAEMSSALASMVSSGGEIERLVPLLEGFGNAVSFSGKGAKEFSLAIYQLSQAYGAGILKMEDWKPIQSQLQGAMQLKEVFIEVGEELGKINKGVIDVTSFDKSLANNWLDKDVMEEAFGRFAEMTEKAFEMVEEGTVGSVAEAYEILAESCDDYRIRAALAAQEAKSFTEAIDATKDAVSTKWMESFQIIFGNYEEATKLWTELTDTLYQLFAASGDTRNEILKVWSAFGGREAMIKSVKAAFNALYKPVQAVKDAIHEIFFPGSSYDKGVWLANATKAVQEFFESLILSDEACNNLRIAFKALLLPVQVFVQLVKIGVTAIFGLIQVFATLIGLLLVLPSHLNVFGDVLRKIFGNDRYERIVAALTTVVENLGVAFYAVGYAVVAIGKALANAFSSKISKAISYLRETLSPIAGWVLDRIVEGFEALARFDYSKISKWAISAVQSLADGFEIIIDWCSSAIVAVKNFFASFFTMSPIEMLNSIIDVLGKFKNGIVEFVRNIGFDKVFPPLAESGGSFLDVLRNLVKAMGDFIGKLTPAKVLIFAFGASLVWTFTQLAIAISAFSSIASGVTGVLDAISGTLNAFQQRIKGSPILQIAVAITVLAVALGALSQIDSNKLITTGIVLGSLMALLGGLTAGMAAVNKFLVSSTEMAKNLLTLTTSMVIMAGAVALLSGALLMLSMVNMDGMISKMITLGVTIGMLVGAMLVLRKGMNVKVTDVAYILAFAAALNLVVYALSNIKEMDLLSNIGTLGTMAIVVGLMVALGHASKGVKPSSGLKLLLMAGALLLFVKAIKPIAAVDMVDIIIALYKIITICSMLALITELVNDKNKHVGLTIAGMAAGILIMYVAIKKLGELDTAVLVKGTAVVGAIMLFIGGMNLISNLTKKSDPVVLQGSFLALSAAILVLGVAINYIGHLDLGTIAKGTTAVLFVLGMLTLLAKSIGSTEKATATVISMSVCIGILITSIALLTLIDTVELLTTTGALTIVFLGLAAMFKSVENVGWKKATAAVGMLYFTLKMVEETFTVLDGLKNPESLIVKAASVGLVLLALAASMRIVKTTDLNASEFIGTIGIMATFALIAEELIRIIGSLDLSNTLEKAGALSAVMLALAASMRIVKTLNVTDATEIIGTMGIMALFGLIAGELIRIIGSLDLSNTLEKAGALSLVMLAVAGCTQIIKVINMNGAEFGATVGIMATLGTIVAAMLAIFAHFTDAEGILAKAGALSISLLAMTGCIAIIATIGGGLGLIGALAKEVLIGSGVALAILGALGLVVIGVGQLFSGEGSHLEEYLTKAEDVLPRLASVIGEFFGSLVGGFIEGVAGGIFASLENLGTSLTNFAENVQGFLTLRVDQELFDSVSRLAGAILLISGAEFLEAILTFGQNDSMERFGQQLTAFGPYFAEFSKQVADIDKAAITASADCLYALALVLSQLPTSGGMWGAVFGNKDLDTFGTGLSTLAQGIVDYADVVSAGSNIDEDTIKKTNTITKMLIDLQNDLPRSGGIFDWLVGRKDLGEFGKQLTQFGTQMVAFFGAIQNLAVDQEKVEGITACANMLVVLANKLPKTGGVYDWLIGKQDIGVFGAQLRTFGQRMVDFFEVIKNLVVDQDKVDAISDAADTLIILANKVPKTGTLVEFLGAQDIGKFGKQIGEFGQGIAGFFIAMTKTGVDSGKIKLAEDAGNAFVRISESLSPNGGLSNLWSNTNLDTFGQQITKLGEGLSGFYEATAKAKVDWADIAAAVTQLERIVTLAPTMESVDKSYATGFKEFLAELARTGITSFTDTFSNAEPDLRKSMYDTIDSAIAFVKTTLESNPTNYAFVMTAIITGIESGRPELNTKLQDLTTSIRIAFTEKVSEFELAGMAIITGLSNALSDKTNVVGKAITNLMTKAISSANAALEITGVYSNKFVTIGKYTIAGYVKGLNDESGKLYNKLTEIGNKTVKTFEQSLGVNSPSKRFAEVGMYTVLGFNKGITDNIHSSEVTVVKMGENLLNAMQTFWGINSPSTLARDEVGRYIIQGIGAGITEDMSAEEAASQKAKEIIEAFQAEFDKWDLDATTADLEFQLWQALNPDASDNDILDQQKQMLDKKLKYQAERVNAANAQYQATLQMLGETAEETQEAYNKFLQEQLSMAKLSQEFIDLQNNSSGVDEDGLTAAQRYANLMESLLEMQNDLGASADELREYALRESGLQKSLDAMKNGTSEVSGIMDQYLQAASGSIDGVAGNIEFTIVEAIPEAVSKATAASTSAAKGLGGSVASGVGAGIAGGADQITNQLEKTVKDALGGLNLDMFKEGGYVGEGLLDGWNEKIKSAGNWVVDAVKGAFSSFTSWLGIHSPSTVMYANGQYIGQGLINGLNDSASGVTNATVNMASNVIDVVDELSNGWSAVGDRMCYDLANGIEHNVAPVINAATMVANEALIATKDELNINSDNNDYRTLGELIDENLANGIIDGSSAVEDAVTQLMDNVQSTIANSDTYITPVVSSTTGLTQNTGIGRARPSGRFVKSENGQISPNGYIQTTDVPDSGWWVSATSEITQSVRQLVDSQAARTEYERQILESIERLDGSIKEMASSPSSINYTQNNYSPESLSASKIYRNTKTALATASANASPTGRSIKST